MLRTGQGPLRPLWRHLYEFLLKAVAAAIRRNADASVYVGGTFGVGEPVFGLSDVDLIVVTPSDGAVPGLARKRIKQHWQRLCKRFPPVSWMLSAVHVYEEPELAEASSATCLTYGLERPASHPAVFLGPDRAHDEATLLVRPGPWVTQEWRRVAGPERRPQHLSADRSERLTATWLELQFWWRLAYETVLAPDEPRTGYLCAKLVAEPARLALWLECDEQELTRAGVLARAIEVMPEEADAFQRARELLAKPTRTRSSRLGEFLPPFVRLSSRVARTLTSRAFDSGETAVRLLGAETAPLLSADSVDALPDGASLRPLVDWRARAVPPPGDEAFFLEEGDPSRPDELAAAAARYRPRVHPALRADQMLAFAGHGRGVVRLRSVQCPATDPVSFAVAAGEEHARFPETRGWSARDSASRAVAEHRAWLDGEDVASVSEEAGGAKRTDSLAMLFSAARAALFLETLEADDPALATTLEVAAEQLAASDPASRTAAEEGFAAYRDALTGGRPPSPVVCLALLERVWRLPAFTRR